MEVRRPVPDLRSLPIDPAHLQARIDQLGAIGVHPNGGLYRSLYDDAWVEGMALLRRWLEEAGLTPRFDAVGNLWGRVEGTAGGAAVVSGSHVDTVRQGGKYDGALGVHMNLFHRDYDLLLTPTLAVAAFDVGKEFPETSGGKRWTDWTPFTYPFNLTQQPAASIP